MAFHLLDTDILIDFLRGRAEARSLLGQYQAAADQLVISVVTVTELWAGTRPAPTSRSGGLLLSGGKGGRFRFFPTGEPGNVFVLGFL